MKFAAMYAHVALLALATADPPAPSVQCTACTLVMRRLHGAVNATKEELEASKAFNDEKAKKIDKVQKAQTKRWLKMEYGVALRAGVEEELENVCRRDELTVSKAVADACAALVETHEDDLPRAAIDGMGWAWCSKVVPGCDEARVKEALNSRRKLKSEKAPKGKALYAAGGVVRRLVGGTYSSYVGQSSTTVFVMLHHSAASAATDYKPNDMRFANAVGQFYALAHTLNGSSANVQFAQMDMQKNEIPGALHLGDPEGLQLALYVGGQEPKLLPQPGEATLAFNDGEELKTRITQFFLSFAKTRDAEIVRHLLRKEKQREVKATSKGAEQQRKRASKPKGATDQISKAMRRKQECDVCLMGMAELAAALIEAKEEMALTHEAAERKQKAIEGVQKAQTKRWLKQEYKVALAAAVEDRLDRLCDSNATRMVCDKQADEEVLTVWHDAHSSLASCQNTASLRCRSLLEDHAEALLRASLDGKGTGFCSSLLSGCDASRSGFLRLLEQARQLTSNSSADASDSSSLRRQHEGDPSLFSDGITKDEI